MRRLAFTALVAGAFAAPAFAANCEHDYRDFFARFSVGPAKQYTGAQLAQVNRAALRGYDACTAGDERFTAENFFKKLEQNLPAKADDIFKEINKNLPAKN
jgi:hypothetical protein